MKLLIFTTSLVLFGVLVFPGILGVSLRAIPNGFQPSLDMTEKINQKKSVEQKFKPVEDGLSIIGMSIKNPNLLNKKDLKLEVLDGDKLQRSVVINGANIPDGDFIKFKFQPITGSKNKELALKLSSEQTEEAESFEVFMTKNRSISFLEFYTPKNKAIQVGLIYGLWFQKLFKDTIFFVSFLSLLTLLVIFIKSLNLPYFDL